MQPRSAAVAISLALSVTGLAACGGSSDNDRWVATANTNAPINWDAIGEAYKKAEGPEDFERRVNEVYTGDEIISIAVEDADENTQVVTGFVDKNTDGKVDEPEKIFTIRRAVKSESQHEVAMEGHGHYAGYQRTSMWDIAGGVIIGNWIARAIMPGTRYATSPARTQALKTQRSSYRAKNPSKFPKSQSGKRFGGSRRGGGSFGVAKARRLTVIRLYS